MSMHTFFEKSGSWQLRHNALDLSENILPGVSLMAAGYNPFGEYASPNSITYTLFDWSKIPTKTVIVHGKQFEVPEILSVVSNEEATYSNITGESVNEFQQNFAASANIEGSYNFFSGSLDVEYSSHSLIKSENAFTRIQQTIHFWSIRLDPNIKNLRDYLSESFLTKLDSVGNEDEAISFFNQYGSHFLTSVVMGGRALMSSAVNKVSLQRSYSLETSASASYKMLTNQISTSEKVKFHKSIESFNSTAETRTVVRGGDAEKGIMAFDGNDGFKDWKDSVADNPDFVDFVPSIPIAGLWEFSRNDSQKKLLKDAFAKWAEFNSIKLQLYSEYVDQLEVIRGKASNIPVPAGYTKLEYDLNKGAGGDYIYLCVHKNKFIPTETYQEGITDLQIVYGKDGKAKDGYTKLPCDLNKNVKGDFVYLWYKSGKATHDSLIKDIRIIGGKTRDVPPDYLFTKVSGDLSNGTGDDLNSGAGGDYIYVTYSKQA